MDVVGALQKQNVFIPSGNLKAGQYDYQIFTDAIPEKVEELTARFRSIVEASPNDAPTWWGRLPWPKPGS